MNEVQDRPPAEEEEDELELLTRPGREEDLRTFLLCLSPVEIADLMHEVGEKTSLAILKHLEPEHAADLLSELSPDEQERVLKLIRPQDAAQIVGQMETDDITDLLQELPESMTKDLLERLPAGEREEVKDLLRYDPSSAGGIMQAELAAVPISATIAEALGEVRRAHDAGVDIISVFVIDEDGRYVGNLALQALVFAPPNATVQTVMTPKVVEVTTDVDQEEVAKIFDRYSLVELAVVERDGRLRGRITADDVHEVLVEEAEEDMMRLAGAAGEVDVVYSDRIFKIAGIRLPWLISTFFAELLATWILQQAAVVFKTMVVLLTFVPLINGMSGNVGSQSAMIMIRGMAVGQIDRGDLVKNLAKDIRVALIMGATCGVAVSGLVSLWHASIWLGLCVGVGLACSMVMASFLGAIEPPILERFGIDPAIAAGPLITSMNDITGVLIYTLVSLQFLPLLM